MISFKECVLRTRDLMAYQNTMKHLRFQGYRVDERIMGMGTSEFINSYDLGTDLLIHGLTAIVSRSRPYGYMEVPRIRECVQEVIQQQKHLKSLETDSSNFSTFIDSMTVEGRSYLVLGKLRVPQLHSDECLVLFARKQFSALGVESMTQIIKYTELFGSPRCLMVIDNARDPCKVMSPQCQVMMKLGAGTKNIEWFTHQQKQYDPMASRYHGGRMRALCEPEKIQWNVDNKMDYLNLETLLCDDIMVRTHGFVEGDLVEMVHLKDDSRQYFVVSKNKK